MSDLNKNIDDILLSNDEIAQDEEIKTTSAATTENELIQSSIFQINLPHKRSLLSINFNAIDNDGKTSFEKTVNKNIYSKKIKGDGNKKEYILYKYLKTISNFIKKRLNKIFVHLNKFLDINIISKPKLKGMLL